MVASKRLSIVDGHTMATLREIAARAGVSICTVSKILNRAAGWENYTPACISRVQHVAEQLGYRRHYLAAALQTGRTDALGMVIPRLEPRDLHNGFISSLICGVEIGARQAGCHFVLVGPSADEDILGTSLRFLEEGRIDGLIVPWFACRGASLGRLERSEKPIVLIGDAAPTRLPVVTIDHAAGIRRAMEHLHELGHRWVWWCGTQHASGIERVRYGAISAAARDLGMTVETLRIGLQAIAPVDEVISAAQRLVAERIGRGTRVTAAVCYNEAIAFGVYAGVRARGGEIPRDLSVIGFDNIYACLATPPMTVVSHMLDVLGRKAVELTLQMRGDRARWAELRGRRIVVMPELIVRGSTVPVAWPAGRE